MPPTKKPLYMLHYDTVQGLRLQDCDIVPGLRLQ